MNRTVKKVFYTVLPLIMFLFATIMIVGIFAATTASVNVDMQMGYEISRGTGTLADPYIIEGVGVNSSSAGVGTFNYYARNNMFTAGNYFKQTMDLEVSDGDLYHTNLEGIYNGNGHTITVTGATTPLFNTITGTLKNVTIINENSTADAGVCLQLGNYSADAGAGTIENVIFKGNITSSSYEPVGGIVKKAGGGAVVKNCGNYADITASNSTSVAGLVAISEGDTSLITIENCFNQGNISCGDTGASYVAGILSKVTSPNGVIATVKNCYNTGSIQIVSSDGSSVSGSAGGIVGGAAVFSNSGAGATLENVYNYSTKVVGGSKGSLATSFYGDTVPYDFTYHSYALVSSDFPLFSNYSSLSSTVQGYFEVKSSTLMQTKSTYSGWTFGTYGQATDGWVWADAEILVDGETQTLALPRLWFETLKSTTQTEYTIASVADLNKYATSEYFGNESYTFTQTADITTSSSLTQKDLAANYDGGGHTIKFTGATSNSLFGTVSGKVSNLNVTVANSSASAICSDLNGTLERIVVRGAISGSGNIGGLASTIACSSRTSIKAKIYQCANYATVESTSGGNAGGIVGFATSSAGTDVVGITYGAYIVDCANYGAITQSGSDSTLSAGGIVGRLNGELLEITNCYNGSDISAYAYAGGILGSVAGTTNVSNEDIKNCVSLASSLSTSYMKGAVGGIVGYSKTADSDIKYLSVFCTAATQYGNGGNTSSTAPYLGATAVQMQKQNIYSASSGGSSTSTSITGFTFGIKGTATSGWVWDDKKVISMDGMEATVKLPGLAWEYL